jgi:two-component system, cell cycle sensor histidine kinase and response regulator CckA
LKDGISWPGFLLTVKTKASTGCGKDAPEVFAEGEGLLLVVDDEPIMRKIAAKVLQKCGYDVMVAEDGEKALECYKHHHQKIKLVLLDLLMPNKSGKETYLEMRQIQPDVKVLLISGAKRDTRIKELLNLGIKGYIEKPYKLPHLARTVHRLIYRCGK